MVVCSTLQNFHCVFLEHFSLSLHQKNSSYKILKIFPGQLSSTVVVVIQLRSDIKVSKWWQNFHFSVNYLFNILRNTCTRRMSWFELERTSKYISTLLSFYEWLTYRKQPQMVLKWKVLRAVSVCVCDLAVSMLTSDSPAVDIRAFPEKSSTSRNIRAATSVASPAGSPEESSPHWSCKTLSPIQSKSQTVALWMRLLSWDMMF